MKQACLIIGLGAVLGMFGAGCGDGGASSETGGQGGAGGSSATGGDGGSATGGSTGGTTTGSGGQTTSSQGGMGGSGGQGGAPDPCAACPGSCCDGACVDLTTSGAHCGQCGHDCEGGACAASVCQPVVVGTGHLVGIDEDEIFVAAASVSRYPKAGGAGTTIGPLAGSKYYLGATAIYATTTGNQGSVNKLVLADGTSTTLASGENNPTYPLEVADHVYWGTTGGVVCRIPVAGGSATNFITGQQIPYELKSDGAKIYFTDTLAQKLKRSDLNGVLGVTDSVPSAARLVVDGTYLYLTGSGKIYQTQADGFGGGIMLVVTLPNDSPIHCLAKDGGDTLIGTDEGLRKNTKMLVSGGAVAEVFADAERVYFEKGGSTYKLVK